MVKYCDSNYGMMRDVALADLNMARERQDCWSKDVSDALATLYSLEDSQDESLATNLHGGVGPLKLKPFNWNKGEKVLFSNHLFFYLSTQSADTRPRDEISGSQGRKNAVYQTWMSSSWDESGKPEMLNYLIRDLPHKVVSNMSRFVTSSHYL